MTSGFQAPISIDEAMKNVIDERYFMPNFKRGFVWSNVEITIFLDSLMRGYPIGSFVFYKFDKKTSETWSFYDSSKNFKDILKYYYNGSDLWQSGLTLGETYERFYVVLDGYQRLMSLYLALFEDCKFEEEDRIHNISRRVYFNLTKINYNTTRRETIDLRKIKYDFN